MIKYFITGIVCLFFVVLYSAISYTQVPKQVPQQVLSSEQVITLPQGTSATQIMAELLAAPLSFWDRLWLKTNPQFHEVKAGTYRIDADADLASILRMFVKGEVVEYSVTLVEGQTLRQWLILLQDAPGLIQDVSYADDAWLYTTTNDEILLEGMYLPDTYKYSHDTHVSDLLKRAERAMQQALDELLAEQSLPKLIPNRQSLITLASIIEKETGVPEERPLIAGVFLNRLNTKMRLQTDPTVIYGIGPAFNGDITRKDLRTKTSHNTYRINGLPPTPIAAPSRESLAAVLNPETTDALYFVAKGDGTHKFSKTLAEHRQAVQKYQLNKK